MLVQHTLRRQVRAIRSESTRVPHVREVEMVIFLRVDDILAHAQATMEKFVVDLGENFKVKSIVE